MNQALRNIVPSSPVPNPSRTASAGLECIAISKTFPGATTPVLKTVSLTVQSNEFFTLLGPSGCGKTTLLRLVAGLETQDEGAIRVGGEVVDGLPPYKRPVNTVFQSYAIFPHLTVAENIAYGLKARRRPQAEIAAKVAEMLALVRLEGLGHRRPRQLSGGQQQRVALARALANQPRVLLLDEPLSALDLKLRTEMQLELKRIQSELGITFIFVTHDQHEALTMSDRIAVMHNGEILQIGTPPEIYESPANRFVAEFIGETNLLEVTALGGTRYQLQSGVEIEGGSASAVGTAATLAIRPEHAVITAAGEAPLKGVVTNVVYLGADQMYYLELEGGISFRIRQTNDGLARRTAKRGETVGVAIGNRAMRVLS